MSAFTLPSADGGWLAPSWPSRSPTQPSTPPPLLTTSRSGYTAKVAGTEQGVTEPEATFSACFGSAFLMWHPVRGTGGTAGGGGCLWAAAACGRWQQDAPGA